MPTLSAICYSDSFAVTTQEMVAAVRSQGLESVVAKRRDSRYEPGQRIGAWVKMRIGGGQEFVIAAIPQVRKLLMHSWSAITRETSLSLSRGCVTASFRRYEKLCSGILRVFVATNVHSPICRRAKKAG